MKLDENALIIGLTPGNIGDAIALEFAGIAGFGGITAIPNIDAFDVRYGYKMEQFLNFRENQYKYIVFSAGVNKLGMIGSLDERAVENIFHTNVIGFIQLLDALVATDSLASGASILAVVSDSATTPMRGSIAYASSKAALAHAVRCAARELAPNYRVNGISPSMVADTPMTDAMDAQIPELRGWTFEQTLDYERSLVPMGRRVTKKEVAELAVSVLTGPEFLTGAIIPISGGK